VDRQIRAAPVEKAIRSEVNAESLLVDVTRLGDTRQYAMRTFTVFVVIAMLLALVSILVASR
jgi:hypothetical protein